jgi:YVTN family beta-propeller protein
MPTANAQATLVWDSTADGNSSGWISVSALGSSWELLITNLEGVSPTVFSTLNIFLSTSVSMPTSTPSSPTATLTPSPSPAASGVIYSVTSAFNWLMVVKTPISTATIAAAVSVGAINGTSFPVINPNTNSLYVANTSAGSVSVLNSLTNVVITVITGLTKPEFIAINTVTNTIYVTGGTDACYVINGATNTLTATVSTVTADTGSTSFDTVAPPVVNPSTNQLYIPMSEGIVLVLNGATNAISVFLGAPSNIIGMALCASAGRLYVITSTDLLIVNASTGAILKTIAITSAFAVAVNQLTNTCYVGSSASPTIISVVSGSTEAVTTTISLTTGSIDSAGSSVYSLLSVDSTSTLYVANSTGGNVVVINETTNAVTTKITATAPFALAFNPTTGNLYSVSTTSIQVINTATNTAGTAISTSSVEPSISQTYVYVAANPNNGNVYFSANSANAGVDIGCLLTPTIRDTQATTLLEGVSGGGGTPSPTTGQLWPLGG